MVWVGFCWTGLCRGLGRGFCICGLLERSFAH